jgi:hypothetical protein
MNAPVKRLTTAIQSHAHTRGLDTEAFDEMASRNLAGLFGLLFEIDQRIKSESPKTPVKALENAHGNH